jgi:NAD(P)-dependent dehydrogenase (short-subunit alcohol dehydrogenase family)
VNASIQERFSSTEHGRAALKDFNSFHPIGLVGLPEDVAETVAFLLLDKSSWLYRRDLGGQRGMTAGRNPYRA